MRSADAIYHDCPKCGAPAGYQCIGKRGHSRAALHRERSASRRPWGNPAVAHNASAVAAEQQAVAALDAIAAALPEIVRPIWHWGDGEGGYVLETLTNALAQMRQPAVSVVPRYRKAKIGHSLRTQVYERDGYACVTCGARRQLTCDHITPESKGGPTTLENLQTMCAPCNSRKGAR